LKIISAEFVTSATGGAMQGIPHDGLPQIAMAGRSNVGKSTLINALCRRKIARTSAAPGKTRLMNVYRIDVAGGAPGPWSLYLVDLPGYGYARGGPDAELQEVAEGYFELGTRGSALGAATLDVGARDSALGVETLNVGARTPRNFGLEIDRRAPSTEHRNALLLVDSRHPGLESDRQAARWLEAMDVEYRVVATKIDKLTRSERARNVKALESISDMPPLAVSAASGEGLDALWKMIASLARTGHE
jgi:GTP-binding protein